MDRCSVHLLCPNFVLTGVAVGSGRRRLFALMPFFRFPPLFFEVARPAAVFLRRSPKCVIASVQPRRDSHATPRHATRRNGPCWCRPALRAACPSSAARPVLRTAHLPHNDVNKATAWRCCWRGGSVAGRGQPGPPAGAARPQRRRSRRDDDASRDASRDASPAPHSQRGCTRTANTAPLRPGRRGVVGGTAPRCLGGRRDGAGRRQHAC